MNEPNLADALAAILKPIVKEAVREAMVSNVKATAQQPAEKSFLTIKQAAEVSGWRVDGPPLHPQASIASAASRPARTGQTKRP